MQDALGRRRSRLLVGVAAVAVAAPVAGKAVAQDAKWQPWLEAGGQVGTSRSFGDVDMFIPVWQDQTSLLFGDLRGKFSTDPTQEGNFGLGYRTQVDPEWILGGYGYFDIQNSQNDNLFYQATLGIEALSVDWDFRLNGYIPFNSGGQSTNNNNGDLKISGNTIGITHDEEKSLYGFDGEVGWRLPIFPADGDMDVRAFIGGYYFTNSDVDTVAGPRGRLEVRLYDLDFLGVQSRLTVDGEVQWDSPRGTQAFGGLELRIPLGVVTGDAGPKLSPLDRRMVDRVQRDVDIVTRQFQSNPDSVTVDELTVKTHTIVFASADGSPTGKGTKSDPISLDAAAARGQALGKNAIIVVEGDAGSIGVDQPLQLGAGQALLGGDSVVPLHSDKGITENFNVPGSRPTLVGTDSSQNMIDMASGSQNEIFGLDLTGQMSNGIFGLNMSRAIVKQTSIESPSAIGIYLEQFTRYRPTPVSSFVHLQSNTVTDAGEYGIDVGNFLYDGAAHSQTVIIDHNIVDRADGAGIVLPNSIAASGTILVQSLTIEDNLQASAVTGIQVSNDAISGAAIIQDLSVGGNTVRYDVSYGIRVANHAVVSASVTQNALVAGNEADRNGYGGINLRNFVTTYSEISQAATITGNSAAANGRDGILLQNLVSTHGSVEQLATVTGNIASGNGRDGILFFNDPEGSGTHVAQSAVVTGNIAAGNGFNGIAFENIPFNSGVVEQSLLVTGNTASGNAFGGIYLGNFSFFFAGLSQSATLDTNLATGNGGDGIFLLNRVLFGSTLQQSAAVTGNMVSANGRNGIDLSNEVARSSLTQSATVTGNALSGNGAAGLALGNRAYSSGTVTQEVAVDGNAIASNAGNGILGANLASSGASATQSVTLDGLNLVTANGLYGLFISNGGAGTAVQTFSLNGNSLSGNVKGPSRNAGTGTIVP
jgi:hypothetical protein